MYCKHCGMELSDGTKYCASCGSVQDDQQIFSKKINYNEEKLEDLSGKILMWGIMALAFAWATCVPFLGIVFGSKAAKLVREYQTIKAQVSGKAKVGQILGQVGFILGIVMTVLVVLIFLIYGCIFGMMIYEEMGGSSYYYY